MTYRTSFAYSGKWRVFRKKANIFGTKRRIQNESSPSRTLEHHGSLAFGLRPASDAVW